MDLVGDALPDLLLVSYGYGPYVSQNRGSGHHWLTIDPGGRWKVGKEDRMRTNPHGPAPRRYK